MTESIDTDISNLGASDGSALIEALANKAENSGDPRSYWYGVQHLLAGAIAAHVGSHASAQIQSCALEVTAAQSRFNSH